jgi:cystathionine beta-lyase
VPFPVLISGHSPVYCRPFRSGRAARLPRLRWTPPEATYLAWLDCSALGRDQEPRELFLAEGRVAVEPGTRFGARGPGHVRLNFATSPEILDEATARMSAACEVAG